MRIIKISFAVLFCLFFAITMTACGDKEENTTTSANETESQSQAITENTEAPTEAPTEAAKPTTKDLDGYWKAYERTYYGEVLDAEAMAEDGWEETLDIYHQRDEYGLRYMCADFVHYYPQDYWTDFVRITTEEWPLSDWHSALEEIESDAEWSSKIIVIDGVEGCERYMTLEDSNAMVIYEITESEESGYRVETIKLKKISEEEKA